MAKRRRKTRSNPSQVSSPQPHAQKSPRVARSPWKIVTFLVVGVAIVSTIVVMNRPQGTELMGVGRDGLDVSILSTATSEQRRKELARSIDPTEDGWDTEAFSTQAMEQLHHVSDFLIDPTASASGLQAVQAEGFESAVLYPRDLVDEFQDARLLVQRWQPTSATEQRPKRQLKEALNDLLSSLTDANQGLRRCKLKIDRVETDGAGARTNVMFEATGLSSGAVREMTANWDCQWKLEAASHPRLTRIDLASLEIVTLKGPENSWMRDATTAIVDESLLEHDFQVGMDDWVNRLDRRLLVSRFGHHGLVVGDVNNDGRDDVYICQPGGLPNRLLVQQSDGTASEEAAAAGINFLDATSSAALVDLDNDGDQDLIACTAIGMVVLANDGHGIFEPRASLRDADRVFSIGVADFDQDGLLDIYVCRYRPDDEFNFELPLPVPYYDANNGGRNYLFRNRGQFQFDNVTTEVGLDQDNTRFSFACGWEDFDNDGDQDLYVANDYGRNCLYRNDGGTFTNVAQKLRVEDLASGMSVAWSDFDHDGLMDVYVSNMFSTAGNRITYQKQFAPGHTDQARQSMQRHARGNTLFQNQPAVSSEETPFRDVSLTHGVTMGRWAWGSLFADLNNDGWDDLLVANGLMTTEDTGDL